MSKCYQQIFLCLCSDGITLIIQYLALSLFLMQQVRGHHHCVTVRLHFFESVYWSWTWLPRWSLAHSPLLVWMEWVNTCFKLMINFVTWLDGKADTGNIVGRNSQVVVSNKTWQEERVIPSSWINFMSDWRIGLHTRRGFFLFQIVNRWWKVKARVSLTPYTETYYRVLSTVLFPIFQPSLDKCTADHLDHEPPLLQPKDPQRAPT